MLNVYGNDGDSANSSDDKNNENGDDADEDNDAYQLLVSDCLSLGFDFCVETLWPRPLL